MKNIHTASPASAAWSKHSHENLQTTTSPTCLPHVQSQRCCIRRTPHTAPPANTLPNRANMEAQPAALLPAAAPCTPAHADTPMHHRQKALTFHSGLPPPKVTNHLPSPSLSPLPMYDPVLLAKLPAAAQPLLRRYSPKPTGSPAPHQEMPAPSFHQ